MKCSEVMTSDPKVCLATDMAIQAAELMKSEDVGPIPIVSDDKKTLVGLVTDRDLVLQVMAAGLDPKATRLEDVMTAQVAACQSDDDAETAIELMEKHHVRRIPIVDAGGKLVGIISQADIATRLNRPAKTSEVVEEISQAA